MFNNKQQVFFIKGIISGGYKAGKDFVEGIVDLVTDPVETIENTFYAIMHPIETYNYISKAISDSYERDVINGDAKSRAEWFSYALTSLALAAVGTKGIGAVSKTGNVSKKFSNLDLLPYKPKNQLATANAGAVPYNVLNGNNLKDKLLSMVEMDGKDTHKGIKTGIGKTGEGIPLEEVKPDVLKQIHPDNNGAYGYLPKKGTDYDEPINNFTNVEWAKEMQIIRKEYLEATKQLEIDIEKMTAEGFSKDKIAEHLVEARNEQKIASRKDMPAEERAALEARNIKRYGNPIGPTAEKMFIDLKENYIEKEIYQSDEQIWGIIIQKSMKKDDVLNTLLGIKY